MRIQGRHATKQEVHWSERGTRKKERTQLNKLHATPGIINKGSMVRVVQKALDSGTDFPSTLVLLALLAR